MGLGGGIWIAAVEGTAPAWAPTWIGWPVAIIGVGMLVVGAILLAVEIKTRWPQGLNREPIHRTTSASGQSEAVVRRESAADESARDLQPGHIESSQFDELAAEDDKAMAEIVEEDLYVRGTSPSIERDSEVTPREADGHQPPPEWAGQFWQGKRITKCPWDDYRTVSDANWIEHLETHAEPPTPELAEGVWATPQQWAKTPLHYLGGINGPSFSGVPADPDHTLYATELRGKELVASGLYALGTLAKQEHGLNAVGRSLVCKCGFEAPTTAHFQSHLSETG